MAEFGKRNVWLRVNSLLKYRHRIRQNLNTAISYELVDASTLAHHHKIWTVYCLMSAIKLLS